MLRGVRGAAPVDHNSSEAILSAAELLMKALIVANEIPAASVSAVFFTVTPDLDACFPAEVRSRIGWNTVPFLCSQEIPVPGAMERVLRVLLLFETDRAQDEIRHCYLGATIALRPDMHKQEEKS